MEKRIEKSFDAIIVGSGQGGTPLAKEFARRGFRTALIEREHVGGTCVNVGCTPTKTFLASARAAHLVRRSGDYGIETGPVRVEMETVRRRKRDIVASFNGGAVSGLEETENLELIYGEATFTAARDLQISLKSGGERLLQGEKIFIDTGGRPAIPPIPGLETVPYLDSTSIMELDQVPRHLAVLGAGYIGIEFAQGLRRFGAEVTIIDRGERILKREDPDVTDELEKILTEDGIRILHNSEVLGVERRTGGIYLQGPDLEVSHLLVAAGRTPNTDALNPAVVGIETDKRGHIIVNERLESSVPGIWALGDVTGGPAFTHVSYDDFRILKANLFEDGKKSTAERIVAFTLFTDPQLGRVGMTETEARKAGREIRIASMPMEWVARALETDESRGMMKAIIDAETDCILGAAVLGMEGGEIMSILYTAMLGEMQWQTLQAAPYAHPTLAESLNNLFTSWKEE